MQKDAHRQPPPLAFAENRGCSGPAPIVKKHAVRRFGTVTINQHGNEYYHHDKRRQHNEPVFRMRKEVLCHLNITVRLLYRIFILPFADSPNGSNDGNNSQSGSKSSQHNQEVLATIANFIARGNFENTTFCHGPAIIIGKVVFNNLLIILQIIGRLDNFQEHRFRHNSLDIIAITSHELRLTLVYLAFKSQGISVAL